TAAEIGDDDVRAFRGEPLHDRRADPRRPAGDDGALTCEAHARIVSRVEVLIESSAVLGEGPRWDAVGDRLLWVDIKRGELHVWDGEDRTVELGALVGSAKPTEAGEIVVALADRLAILGENGLRDLVRFPHGGALRANDGLCDRDGRLWIGTMMIDESPGGALYRYDG